MCDANGLGSGTTCALDCGCGPTCPNTVEPTKGNGSITRITFVRTIPSGANTEYQYDVCKLAGSDLSHWVLGTDCCNNIVSSSAPAGESPGTSCGTDPTTGLFGVKFDETSPITACSSGTDRYTITISGPAVTGCIKVATKANGMEDIASACIQGPTCPELCEFDSDCPDEGVPCTNETCDPTNPNADAFGCVSTPDAAKCDDGVGCTNDSCDPINDCQHVPNAAKCDDGVDCTNDSCDPINDCQHVPNDAKCPDDGNSCTTDSCDLVDGCVYTPDCTSPDDCDDSNPCTEDTCDQFGCCIHIPDCLSALDCDDSIACTNDSCNPAACCAHTPVDSKCDDGVACTNADVCDPTNPLADADGCVITPVDSKCDDGATCTNADLCDPGNPLANADGCVITPVDSKCDDGVACTNVDVCDPGNPLADADGCVFTPVDSKCDDGNPCNGPETCDETLGCQPGSPPPCVPIDDCFTAACNSVTGECDQTPITCPDDGNLCTIEACVDGICGSTPVTCNDDGQFCNGDEVCDPNTGACRSTGSPCGSGVCCESTDRCVAECCSDSQCPDNGVFCDGVEVCDESSGVCVSPGNPCEDPLCCDVESDSCQLECIPTTSQWGLVIMALLLIVGSKLYFGRRSDTDLETA